MRRAIMAALVTCAVSGAAASDAYRDEIMGLVVESCASSAVTRHRMDFPESPVPSTATLIQHTEPGAIEELIEDVQAKLQPGMDYWQRMDMYVQFAEACDQEFGLWTPIDAGPSQ